MKTLPLVDRNMFSYSFIPDLPLSLEEKMFIYENTEASVEPAGPRLCVLGNGPFTGRFCPG